MLWLTSLADADFLTQFIILTGVVLESLN